jgi:hypothetical protein
MSNSIQDLLNSDPILYAFIRGVSPTVTGTITSWKSFPTSDKENLNDGNIPTTPSNTDFSKRENISLYFIQEFDTVQSSKIKAELASKKDYPRIRVDNYGNVSVGAGFERFTGPFGDAFKKLETNRKLTLTPDTAAESIRDNFISSNMYSWSEKFFISPNLKYIIIYDENKKLYYNCINPLHSRGFKEYYKKTIIGSQSNSSVDYGAAFLPESEPMKAITRYCNAFIVEGKNEIIQTGAKRIKPLVYLDPFCGVLIDKNTAALNRHYNSNIVSHWYKNKFFKTQAIAKNLTEIILEGYQKPGVLPFTCPKETGIYALGASLKAFGDKSNDSFMYEYAAVSTNGKAGTSFSYSDTNFTVAQCPEPDNVTCTLTIIADQVNRLDSKQDCGNKKDDTLLQKYQDAISDISINPVQSNTQSSSAKSPNGAESPKDAESPGDSKFPVLSKLLDGIVDEKYVPYLVIGVIIFVVLIILGLILSSSSTQAPVPVLIQSK